jgi:hypothetical protein
LSEEAEMAVQDKPTSGGGAQPLPIVEEPPADLVAVFEAAVASLTSGMVALAERVTDLERIVEEQAAQPQPIAAAVKNVAEYCDDCGSRLPNHFQECTAVAETAAA